MSLKTMVDEGEFYRRYMTSSKFANKNALYKDFCSAWYDVVGMGLGAGTPINTAKRCFKDTKMKAAIKAKLKGWGYTDAAITGIFKAFSEQLKNN